MRNDKAFRDSMNSTKQSGSNGSAVYFSWSLIGIVSRQTAVVIAMIMSQNKRCSTISRLAEIFASKGVDIEIRDLW